MKLKKEQIVTELYGSQKGVREILLTFDDGPNPKTTPRLLDILAANAIKAMFFMVGARLTTVEGRSIMERAFKEGHQIGNHTFSHRDLKTLSDQKVRQELLRAQELIADCGDECRFFRPPYGAINAMVSNILKEENYMTVLWSVDTLDWKLKKQGAWVEHGMQQIKAREDSIVLMHDIHSSTVNHAEELIARIKKIPNVKFVQYA